MAILCLEKQVFILSIVLIVEKEKMKNITKKIKINPKKLSRIITSRECMSALEFNLHLYSCLTIKQRQEIKEMLYRIKNEI